MPGASIMMPSTWDRNTATKCSLCARPRIWAAGTSCPRRFGRHLALCLAGAAARCRHRADLLLDPGYRRQRRHAGRTLPVPHGRAGHRRFLRPLSRRLRRARIRLHLACRVHLDRRCRISIPDAQLWWPKGYGDPALYTVTAQLLHHDQVVAERTDRIGLRQVDVKRTEIAGTSVGPASPGARLTTHGYAA